VVRFPSGQEENEPQRRGEGEIRRRRRKKKTNRKNGLPLDAWSPPRAGRRLDEAFGVAPSRT
jgi:hypothetical protein